LFHSNEEALDAHDIRPPLDDLPEFSSAVDDRLFEPKAALFLAPPLRVSTGAGGGPNQHRARLCQPPEPGIATK
jgi:hypothetical protein